MLLLISMLGFPMVQKNNISKLNIDSIVEELVCYYVNLGYGKYVDQFVILKLYNELKLESMAIKIITLGSL